MGKLIILAFVVLLGTAAALASSANATLLYGATLHTGELVTIDTSTGAGTVVGPLGFTGIHGLSFDPMSGVLFGVEVTGRRWAPHC